MKNSGRYAAYGLAGRIALVTGGSKNIGRQIVSVLAEAGAVPVILFREDEASARKVCDEIEKNGGRAGMVRADMADVGALRDAVRCIERDFGGVDILINNAALRPNSKITAISVEEWDRVLNTNLRGPFFLSQAVLPGMVRRKWGRIINIGGVDAYWGKTRRAHNVSAKLGLVGLTRTLANEVARHGVTVNIVVPGTTDTYRHTPEWYPELDKMYEERKERTPMARLGTPREVADACAFLASELASYTTAQEFFVTGGAFPLVRSPSEEYPPEQFGGV
jgi:NAD(P)-dependent dehydrogenase (short-subunit alcohol dehydrogenase family)